MVNEFENDYNKDDKKSKFALEEEKILEFWGGNSIFEKSLKKESPKGDFIFYEGPPTANGNPGIHHLESRVFKDVIPRYKTMRGYHVGRRAGWDTHGLPVEVQTEKRLGLNSKKKIEEYGIGEFNEECRKSLWEYIDIWEKFTDRIGYWVDKENFYATCFNDYIESVWNLLKTIYDKNLLYKDYRVGPWCFRCGTTLSSNELAQPDAYKDIQDIAVYVKFKVKNLDNTYILVWTTTPWTLPGNVALAIGKKISYIKIKIDNEFYILAKDRLENIMALIGESNSSEHKEVSNQELLSYEYEPIYPFLKESLPNLEKEKLKNSFKIYNADFVNTEEGTGIVHIAPMYGQDDFELGEKVCLPKFHLVNKDGKFILQTGFLADLQVKNQNTDIEIIKDLHSRGLLFKKEKYTHSYPHCWRCNFPLIYYACDSWYIRMSDPLIREKMISENKEINWEPSHIRDGRFGEWLNEGKDWALSRERYWGTPLPIWECENKTCQRLMIGSIGELQHYVKKSNNKYFYMRHGEADNNVSKLFYCDLDFKSGLTDLGKEQVVNSIKNFQSKIDLIISSNLKRAVQTTEIVSMALNLSAENIIYEEKIREWEADKKFDKTDHSIPRKYFHHDYIYSPEEKFSDGENFSQVVKRAGDFIYDIDSKYQNKNILIIGHAAFFEAIQFVLSGSTFLDLKKIENKQIDYIKHAEIKQITFNALPHNEKYELDLHRPYIDEIKLICKCGKEMKRAKDVIDVWFDSGAMPFAVKHFPFSSEKLEYPADFISEAIDQTRGWFYTLHAVGILMGHGKAYKNVICLGHLLDAKGKKMSKSLGNVIEPFEMINKYGADTLRFWMYSINQPGESKNFNEKTVLELQRQVFNLLDNILAFYELYRDFDLEIELEMESNKDKTKENNILDQWILLKLNDLIKLVTDNLDNYKILEPARAIKDFINDLSTWYLRRSRERIKDGSTEAKQTLYIILKNLAKLIAPFSPFFAERIWQKLKNKNDAISIHLSDWPREESLNTEQQKAKQKQGLCKHMQATREIVSIALKLRQDAGIQVKQPLSKIKIKNLELPSEFLELIKDEVNVKEINKDQNLAEKVWLDTNISQELEEQGSYRELLRAIQELRKENLLIPSDKIILSIQTDQLGEKIIKDNIDNLKKSIGAEKIEFSSSAEKIEFFPQKIKPTEIKIKNTLFLARITKI